VGRYARTMPTPESAPPVTPLPRRILVAGTSGSGKSTLAARIAEIGGLPYVEIDSLFHGPDWTPRPEFERDVDALLARPSWVTEWQYTSVRARLAAGADALVWLDYPRLLVMRRVIRRTVARRIRRVELWNGNTEPPLGTILTDPDHIIRWAWRTHAGIPAMVRAAAAANPALEIVRLRSPRATERWLQGAAQAVGASMAPPKRRFRPA
jgi:adenylate kinase family enzyme